MTSLLDISTWGRRESPFQTLLSVRTACLIAIAGAIATVTLAHAPTIGLVIGCLSVLGLFVCYPAFSFLWHDTSGRAAELCFAPIGLVTVALAITVDPRWLALGWALHGGWDALHLRDHHVIGLRGIPPWWVQGCIVWDLLAAIGIALFL